MGLVQLVYLFWLSYYNFVVFAEDTNILCNVTVNERLEYKFDSDIVNTEHIITFKGYYSKTTRENYVNAALKNAQVINKYHT